MENKIEKMNEVDKITFELLLNKNQYNRYLSVMNPQKLDEQEMFFKKMGIQYLLNNFLDDPKKLINNELNESLHDFLRTCIKYLENTDIGEQPTKSYYPDRDDDILFDEKRMDDDKISTDSLDKISKAFWAIPKKR